MKKKKINASSVLLLLLGLGMIGVALYLLLPTLFDYQKAENTYHKLEEEYLTVEGEVTVNEDDWWYENVQIDLNQLKEINEDVVGWIRFDNIEEISYPVLYSGDDETYLRMDLYGNAVQAGSIFMEGTCTPDFEDSHTILYGHNMKNLSMFGSLKKYKTEDFYEDNQFFTIYTEDMAYRYQIFAYRDVSEADTVYTTGFGANEEFQQFVDEMKRQSYQDTGVEVSKDDKIVTLSTCSTEGMRFIVQAVQIEAHSYEK